jgi:hypothetical protein
VLPEPLLFSLQLVVAAGLATRLDLSSLLSHRRWGKGRRPAGQR